MGRQPASAYRYLDTSPYWEGLRSGRLVLQYCCDTGRFQHVPRPISLYTGSRNLGWREVCGRGVLVAWTTPRVLEPAFETRVPVHQILVDLDEDVRMLALLMNHEQVELRAGLRLRVLWETGGIDRRCPVFAPDGG